MDEFKESYVTLFSSVSKSIENLEYIKGSSKLPASAYISIEKEINALKDAQIMAEEQFISKHVYKQI